MGRQACTLNDGVFISIVNLTGGSESWSGPVFPCRPAGSRHHGRYGKGGTGTLM